MIDDTAPFRPPGQWPGGWFSVFDTSRFWPNEPGRSVGKRTDGEATCMSRASRCHIVQNAQMKNVTEQMDVANYCSDLGIEIRTLVRKEIAARVAHWRGQQGHQDALEGGEPRRFDPLGD